MIDFLWMDYYINLLCSPSKNFWWLQGNFDVMVSACFSCSGYLFISYLSQHDWENERASEKKKYIQPFRIIGLDISNYRTEDISRSRVSFKMNINISALTSQGDFISDGGTGKYPGLHTLSIRSLTSHDFLHSLYNF